MTSAHLDCPSLDADSRPCGSLPPGFSRLRYFFGKRLAVADFVDEQRYHAGKQRFHGQRLHGSGVLCGLGAEVLAIGGAPDTTLLRVGKGAAVDACGREIVVGYDQCIDVDAWYRRERAARLDADPTSTWPEPELDGDGLLPLRVILRYRECATSPEPAPRDPCSCAEGGSDYGRVREEFELELVVATDSRAAVARPVHPDLAAIDAAVAASPGGAALAADLAARITAACPGPIEDDWILLASLRAEPSADRASAEALSDVRTAAPALFSTALLQELALRELAAGLEAGALARGGPEITAVTLAPGGNPDEYVITLSLSAGLVGATVTAGAFALRQLSAVSGWQAPAGGTTVTAAYQDTPAPAIAVTIAGATPFFADGGLYRLALVGDPAEPIADAALRPLRPLRFSWNFSLVDDAGVLRMAPAPQAP